MHLRSRQLYPLGWAAALSVALGLLWGCQRAEVAHDAAPSPATATNVPVRGVVFRSATPSPTATLAGPTATPAPILPTPTPQLAALAFSEDALQYWADPNNVSAVVYTPQGIWGATGAGVVCWTPDGQQRLHTPVDGLASPAIQGLAVDADGHIWVGYADQDGWSEYDGAAWRTYPTRREAVAARYAALLRAQRFDPRLWVARADSDWVWLPDGKGGLESYDGSRWRVYSDYFGVTPHTWLVGIAEDGRLWGVGTGVSTAIEGERWWNDHNLFSEIGDRDAISSLAVDADGSLLLAFGSAAGLSGGLARLSIVDETPLWQGHLAALNPHIPAEAYAVRVDDEGAIWLGGQEALAYRPAGQPWRHLTLAGLAIHDMAQAPDGRLWLATDQGLASMLPDGSGQEGPRRMPSPLLGGDITGLARDSAGRLYVATRRGVAYIQPDGRTGVALLGRLHSLAADRVGHVWACAADGLYRLEGDAAPQRVEAPAATRIAFDAANTPYVLTVEGQLLRLGAAGAEPVADLGALAGASPRDLEIDEAGTAWFATEAGAGALAPDGTFTLATGPDALLSSDVRAVSVGAEGLVWAATAKGLARHRPDGRWTRFTTESTEGGLRAMEMWALHAEPSGVVWMATDAGISLREPENADWFCLDLPGVRHIQPDGAGGAWLATRSGLYRVQRAALTAVP